MEKSEAVRSFNVGKHFVETCLKDIASLELNNDKELRQVLRGTVMVEVSYKAAENFGKVAGYVLDGKDGAKKLKDELFDLKEKVVQLYNVADRQNLVTIKTISEAIISEIKEVEEWTGDDRCLNTEDKYPTIPKELKDLFSSVEQCESFVKMNYGKSHKIVANAYLEEKRVVHPDSPKYVAVRTILYNYFILPFKPKDGEKRNNIYCVPSTFYKHFKY